MPKATHSARHARLIEILVQCRRDAGLTQAEVAGALGRHQPFIANIESGRRRIDVVELFDLADVIGLDVEATIAELSMIKPDASKRKPR